MKKNKFVENIRKLFRAGKGIDSDFFDDLSDALVEGDVGVKTACEIISALETACRNKKISDEDAVFEELRLIFSQWIKSAVYTPEEGAVSVYMLLGVNGTGKTTTAAKMACWYKDRIKMPVVLAAADTFRAAASEQLAIWGERNGVNVIRHGEGADPAAVIYDAIQSAKARNTSVLICDTAGRLQNKKNLMAELEKMNRVIDREYPQASRETLLILDATTGKNAVSQAQEFSQVADITGIIITKLDGTARGGIALTVADEFDLPVKFIGVGEKIDDLKPFVPEEFIGGIFDE